jgi:hypothetical protein
MPTVTFALLEQRAPRSKPFEVWRRVQQFGRRESKCRRNRLPICTLYVTPRCGTLSCCMQDSFTWVFL